MNEAVVFIPLTQGYVAVIDFDDFEKVRGTKWHVAKRGRRFYAGRHRSTTDGGGYQFLHQLLRPNSKQTDHVDGDGLNNRQENLRSANHRKNQQGFQRKAYGKTSKYRGVRRRSDCARWSAEITANGKHINLGLFTKERDAARAYDNAARQHFGEFASPNFKK